MNTDSFKTAYNMSRNGTDGFKFNRFYPKLHYSDGVQECVEAGTYWLLDIIGTECVPVVKGAGAMGLFTATVRDGKAHLTLELNDDEPPVWSRPIEYTDMPDGDWKFFLVDEGPHVSCILPTEY